MNHHLTEALHLLKRLKHELHGKLEQSAEEEIDALIYRLEVTIQLGLSEAKRKSLIQDCLFWIGFLVRLAPEISKFLSGH